MYSQLSAILAPALAHQPVTGALFWAVTQKVGGTLQPLLAAAAAEQPPTAPRSCPPSRVRVSALVRQAAPFGTGRLLAGRTGLGAGLRLSSIGVGSVGCAVPWRSYGAAAAAAAAAASPAAATGTAAAAPSFASAASSSFAASADEGSRERTTSSADQGTREGATTSAAPLSFSDHRAVFEGQSTWQLLRAYGALRMCGFKPLVSNAEALLATSQRLLGATITDALIKPTFFSHFCAGEDVSEVQRTVDRLRGVGVGAILDYAAEDDVGSSAAQPPPAQPPAPAAAAGSPEAAAASEPSARALGVVGRTYDYASEEQCDRHVDHFLAAIEMAAKQPGRPAFAAIKMTALGNPALLERASTAVSTLHGLFARFDEDGSGFIDRGEFQRQWRRLLAGGGSGAGGDAGGDAVLAAQGEEAFRWLDLQGTGKVDYVSWCQRLDLPHMPLLADRITAGGGGEDGPGGDGAGNRAVAAACLDEREVAMMDALLGRLQRLVAAAMRLDVRLMIDAEHTYFQPAIDHVTLRLMREHNRGGAARVLNTYQAYLVDSRGRLLRDMERARREGWVLGAKLVRGAYLHLERRRAEQLGLPSPVWGELAETHANYDCCLGDLLAGVREGRAEVLLGTHNQGSVESAVALMALLGLPPASRPGTPGVMFGQLLGMSDHLTLTLGKAGYRAYKYVPYGRVRQVMPYLLRRAAENQDIMKGSKQDLVMLRSELRRRAGAALGLAA